MTELHASPEAAEAALRREWAAKGHDHVYAKNVAGDVVVDTSCVNDEPSFNFDTFAGRSFEIQLAKVDPELIKIMTGETPAWIDTNEHVKPKGKAITGKPSGDAWANLSTYSCSTCRFFVPKREADGRCRRHAPTMDGYPVVYPADWCGDHKLGTNPSREA